MRVCGELRLQRGLARAPLWWGASGPPGRRWPGFVHKSPTGAGRSSVSTNAVQPQPP